MKALIILILVGYLIYRIGGFFFRLLIIGASQQRNQHAGNSQNAHSRNSRSRKADGSNLNIDYVPEKESKKNKKFKGGEYVDYEEVS